jgi:uncharacterized protein YigE (DUF2233 family)
MKIKGSILLLLVLSFEGSFGQVSDSSFLYFIPDLKTRSIRMYWKDENDVILRNLGNLNSQIRVRGDKLVFGMNGGMFTTERKPQGLYIENGEVLSPLDTLRKGYGNFYLQPNGVFYLTRGGVGRIAITSNFKISADVQFATQSGPMLVIDGKISSHFTEGSSRVNIRNGVGILPDGRIMFAVSVIEVNLYDFANFFLKKGCRSALYLDGFVSKVYYPEKNVIQEEGNLGILIGVTEDDATAR